MSLNQSTNSPTNVVPIGGVAAALACALAMPAPGASGVAMAAAMAAAATTVVAKAESSRLRITQVATTDTYGASKIQPGALRESSLTLIGVNAQEAIGPNGLKRLASFFALGPGWDGPDSKPISLGSVGQFSSFFEATGLRPHGLGVFMSSRGNVIVNWPDDGGDLIELEFTEAGIDYFVERTEDEGTFKAGNIGFAKLLSRFEEPVLA